MENYEVNHTTINETILDHIMEQLSLTDIITILNKMPTDVYYEDANIRHMIGKYIIDKKFS